MDSPIYVVFWRLYYGLETGNILKLNSTTLVMFSQSRLQ